MARATVPLPNCAVISRRQNAIFFPTAESHRYTFETDFAANNLCFICWAHSQTINIRAIAFSWLFLTDSDSNRHYSSVIGIRGSILFGSLPSNDLARLTWSRLNNLWPSAADVVGQFRYWGKEILQLFLRFVLRVDLGSKVKVLFQKQIGTLRRPLTFTILRLVSSPAPSRSMLLDDRLIFIGILHRTTLVCCEKKTIFLQRLADSGCCLAKRQTRQGCSIRLSMNRFAESTFIAVEET